MIKYTVDGVSHTILQWITPEGELLESEEIPLGEVFGQRKYEVISAHIIGDYYCFTANNCKLPNTSVFRRDGDTFYPVSTGDYLLGYDKDCCSDGAITFGLAYESLDPNRTGNLCGAAKVDFINKTLTVCEIPVREQDNESFNQSCYITPWDEFVTICRDGGMADAPYEYAAE